MHLNYFAARVAGCLILGASLPAQAQEIDGTTLFNDNCAVCHAEGGTGNPGFAPPLNRPAFWQAMDAPTDYVAAVVIAGLHGTMTVDGQMYAGLRMPPLPQIEATELAAIATYVAGELGETEADATVESVAAVRAELPDNAALMAARPAE